MIAELQKELDLLKSFENNSFGFLIQEAKLLLEIEQKILSSAGNNKEALILLRKNKFTEIEEINKILEKK